MDRPILSSAVDLFDRYGWVLAIGLAVAAFVAALSLSQQPTLGLGASTGVLAAYAVLVGARERSKDRADLQSIVELGPATTKPPTHVILRIVNHGRRPARIESAGFAQVKRNSAASTPFRGWGDEKGNMYYGGRLDIDLSESHSVELSAWTKNVVQLCGQHCRWVYFRDSHFRVTWRSMPREYFDALPAIEARLREEADLRERVESEKRA